jgi:hypothetical protein
VETTNMAAIYSNGSNRWNILGFNITKRDALSSVYKISILKPHWPLFHKHLTFNPKLLRAPTNMTRKAGPTNAQINLFSTLSQHEDSVPYPSPWVAPNDTTTISKGMPVRETGIMGGKHVVLDIWPTEFILTYSSKWWKMCLWSERHTTYPSQ